MSLRTLAAPCALLLAATAAPAFAHEPVAPHDDPAVLDGEMSVLRIIPLLVLLLRAAAIFYLFQPDSKAWLTRDDAEPAEPVQSD